MIDYKGLEALYTIIEMQGFETAAEKLNISQSAVSQRLKSLQNYYGDPLLIRTQPYQTTRLGKHLIGHFKRINILEISLSSQINNEITHPKISIAISRDSLETWFMKAIEKKTLFSKKTIEIITDDQEITLDYLQKGLVTACFSTQGKALDNCQVTLLGYMDYMLVASSEFKQKYFSNNQHKTNLINAPAIIFDKNDKLHDRYLKKFFSIDSNLPTYHTVPSVHGFKKFTLLGYGYALIPKLDITNELKEGKLIQLFKQKTWKMPVYLHNWNIDDAQHKSFYKELISTIKPHLTSCAVRNLN